VALLVKNLTQLGSTNGAAKAAESTSVLSKQIKARYVDGFKRFGQPLSVYC